MKMDSKEKIETFFNKLGIKGEWIKPDKYGFSRNYQFKIGEQTFVIEWYCNYSTLICGAIAFWFTDITHQNTYPVHGDWIEFIYGNEKLHVNIAKSN